jgi:putative endonuclease
MDLHFSPAQAHAANQHLSFNHPALLLSFAKLRSISKHESMRERSYYVYIIASRTRVLYTGVTGNIVARAVQHKTKYFEGFTADYNCCRLVWYESYDNPKRAIGREKQIKRWTRVKKLVPHQQTEPHLDRPQRNLGQTSNTRLAA